MSKDIDSADREAVCQILAQAFRGRPRTAVASLILAALRKRGWLSGAEVQEELKSLRRVIVDYDERHEVDERERDRWKKRAEDAEWRLRGLEK